MDNPIVVKNVCKGPLSDAFIVGVPLVGKVITWGPIRNFTNSKAVTSVDLLKIVSERQLSELYVGDSGWDLVPVVPEGLKKGLRVTLEYHDCPHEIPEELWDSIKFTSYADMAGRMIDDPVELAVRQLETLDLED